MTCPHDVQPSEGHVWAGPVGTCRCCGLNFGYIGRGFYTGDYEDTVEPDPTLCTPCGGKPRVIRKGNRPDTRIGRAHPDTGEFVYTTIPAGYEDFYEPGTLEDE